MIPPSLIAPSTWDEFNPAYSPDGAKIAFMSARSSFWEIWVADADGSNPRQLTRMGSAYTPRWSPDSSQIVFNSVGYPEGADDLVKVHFRPNRREVYVIDASGGLPRKVSDIGESTFNPSFSADGRWIYFEGKFDPICEGSPLWMRRIDTGEQTQVADCVIRHLEGPDGRMYFFVEASGGIVSMPATGGDYRLELSEEDRRCLFQIWGWTFWGRNLVFIDCVDQKVRMLDLDTREIREVADPFIDKTNAGTDLDVSPDGKWIIYSLLERAGSDLMLVEPFQ
jgi:Tol biopolymer transport system component